MAALDQEQEHINIHINIHDQIFDPDHEQEQEQEYINIHDQIFDPDRPIDPEVALMLHKSPNLKAFQKSVESGDDIDFIRDLLQRHPEIMEESRSKMWSVLDFACRYGRFEVVKHLLEIGSDGLLTETSKEGFDETDYTCVYAAVSSKHYDVVRLLISVLTERNLEHIIDQWNGDEEAPIHEAATYGDIPMLKLFHECHPSSFSIADGNGRLPIFHAIDDLESTKYLLSLNPDWIEERDHNDMNIFHAAFEYHRSLPTAKYLLNRFPHLLHGRTENGFTPLHYAANAFFDEFKDKHGSQEDSVIFLLQEATIPRPDEIEFDFRGQSENSDLEVRSIDDQTPFDIAVEQGHIITAKILAACSDSNEEKEQMKMTEGEILSFRARIYFDRSLLSRLIHPHVLSED